MSLITQSNDASSSTAEQVKHELVSSVFCRAKTVFIGHMTVVGIYALWLATALSSQAVLTWVGVSAAICALQFCLCIAYQGQSSSKLSEKRWMQLWVSLSVAISLSYAYACTLLSANLGPQYTFSGVALVFAVIACVTICYARSIAAIASLAIPLCVASVVYLMSRGLQIEFYLGLSIIAFVLMCFVAVREIHKSLVKAIEVQYQYKQEAEKLKLLERQLYDISRRDSLTGLFNRRYFDEMLEVELGRAYRNHTSLCLVLVDVDYFSEYNEHYGHESGDNCLMNVAHLLEQETNRKGDLVARYSGAEFAVILPGIDAKGAVAFASRLQRIVQDKRIEHKSTKLTSLKSVTVSVGVTSVLPLMKMKPNQLIDQADKALFDAKKDGRNRVKAFSPFGIDHQDLS